MDDVFHQSLLDITTDQMNQLFTSDANNENQEEQASQAVDNQPTTARDQTISDHVIGGTPSPRMGSYGDENLGDTGHPGGAQGICTSTQGKEVKFIQATATNAPLQSNTIPRVQGPQRNAETLANSSGTGCEPQKNKESATIHKDNWTSGRSSFNSNNDAIRPDWQGLDTTHVMSDNHNISMRSGTPQGEQLILWSANRH